MKTVANLPKNINFFCFLSEILFPALGWKNKLTWRIGKMTIKQRNAVKLAGDLVSVDEKCRSIVVLTKQTRRSGTYEDRLEVIVPDGKLLAKMKPNQKIKLYGFLDRSDEKFSTQIVADPKMIKLGKNAGSTYENRAQLVGTVPFSAGMLPSGDGKVSLINLAVEVGGKIFNGVAFRQLATIFDRVWTKRSIAKLDGRIRFRKFVDGEGDTQVSLEIVVEDKAETRILKRASVDDEFGDYGYVYDGDDTDQKATTPEAAPVPAV